MLASAVLPLWFDDFPGYLGAPSAVGAPPSPPSPPSPPGPPGPEEPDFTSRVIDHEPTLLRQSFQLRYQVYCLERGLLPAEDYPDHLETDAFDKHSIHIGTLDRSGTLVGTARLVRPNIAGLPIFDHCDISSDEIELHRAHSTMVELSRLAVSRQYRRPRNGSGKLVVTLYRSLYETSKAFGYTHWLTATEPSLQRLVSKVGFPFRQVGPEIDYFGPVAPYLMDLREFDLSIYSGRFPVLRTFRLGSPPYPTPLPATPKTIDSVVLELANGRLRLRTYTEAGIVSVGRHSEAQSRASVLLAQRLSLFLSDEVEEFEALLNSSRSTERDIQRFLEAHPTFLTGTDYSGLFPQVVLERDDDGPLIPDFLLRPHDSYLCDILDIKLPSQTLIVGSHNRQRFSSALMQAIAQLRTYRDYFEDRARREWTKRRYGVTAYRPKLTVVAGRRIELDPVVYRQVLDSASSVRVLTYDDLLVQAKRRTLFEI